MDLESRKNEIIDLYTRQNLTTVQIANMIGCSNTGVGRLLKRNGIVCYHTPSELKLTNSQRSEICRLYQDENKTSIELGEMYGVCDRSITNILRANIITVRPAVRRSPIKHHDYFASIDTIDKAYYLGWMISDGSVVEHKTRKGRNNTISLEIISTDRYILESFATFLGGNESLVHDFIRKDRYNNHSYIRFVSAEMSNDLSKYGVIPRKSDCTYLPCIRDDLMPHLIRGIFDGNGTITIDKRYGIGRFAFFGSQEVCTNIRDRLHNDINLGLSKVSKSTCYHVWWSGVNQCRRFYEYIYNNCGDLYLTRKRIKFDKCI